MEYLRAKDLSEAKKRFRELGFFNLVDQEETTTEGHLPALLENFNSQMANILTSNKVFFLFFLTKLKINKIN